MIAGQVITQLMAGDEAGGGSAGGGSARGFGLLAPPLSQASGTAACHDYRSLLEAVAAAAAETGGPVTCAMAAQRAGFDVIGRQSENVRAKLKRPDPGRAGWPWRWAGLRVEQGAVNWVLGQHRAGVSVFLLSILLPSRRWWVAG